MMMMGGKGKGKGKGKRTQRSQLTKYDDEQKVWVGRSCRLTLAPSVHANMQLYSKAKVKALVVLPLLRRQKHPLPSRCLKDPLLGDRRLRSMCGPRWKSQPKLEPFVCQRIFPIFGKDFHTPDDILRIEVACSIV